MLIITHFLHNFKKGGKKKNNISLFQTSIRVYREGEALLAQAKERNRDAFLAGLRVAKGTRTIRLGDPDLVSQMAS